MRGQWSEHEARAILSAWWKSGEKLESFAKRRGLVPQRLRWWRKKLDPELAPAAAPQQSLALLPVKVTAAAPKRGEPIAVLLRSGHVIKLGRGFDEEAFARAVAVLEGL